MEISDQLLCLFSGNVEQRDDSYVVEVPRQELDVGAVTEGATYRVALLSDSSPADPSATDTGTDRSEDRHEPDPPVDEGDRREVEIDAIGDQGDGITRVERGFVVVVPETDQGERVTIEITDVRQNVAFADVVERHDHFG
ncbi:MAG: putative RNA-binding protein with TRAM domain [Salinirussus sp.]|jgi:predicted RNA-binding protein with TRAM domain